MVRKCHKQDGRKTAGGALVGEWLDGIGEAMEEEQRETLANTKKAFCARGMKIRIEYLESPKGSFARDTKRLDWIEHIQKCPTCREFFNFCAQQAAIVEVTGNGNRK